jgi:hypothetical protein
VNQETFANISKIIERDTKVTTYKLNQSEKYLRRRRDESVGDAMNNVCTSGVQMLDDRLPKNILF